MEVDGQMCLLVVSGDLEVRKCHVSSHSTCLALGSRGEAMKAS